MTVHLPDKTADKRSTALSANGRDQFSATKAPMFKKKEEVIELQHAPQASTGAPLPVVVSDEHSLYCVYRLENNAPGWNGKTSEMKSVNSPDNDIAIIKFPQFLVYQFGPPNDESFNGHPLYPKGLRPYGIYEIKNSTWIVYFEKMNSVHPFHRKDRFDAYNHYVFSFHDTTLEVIAEKFEIKTTTGSIGETLSLIAHNISQD